MALPSTRGRLAPSIKIRTIQYDNDGNEEPGIVLGAVRRLSKKENRNTNKLMGLGKYAFRPYTIVPGAVNISVTLNRVVLYKNDALEAILGENFETIFYQRKPFIIEVIKYTPFGKMDSFRIYDCWIISNPITFDVMATDLLVSQELEIVGGMVEPKKLSGNLGFGVTSWAMGKIGIKL